MENHKENSFEIEIPPKATRRVIAPSYKARILKEYDSLDTNGRGALLRREGLYSSHISNWRKTVGVNGDLPPAKTKGPKPKPEATRIKSLEKENQLRFYPRGMFCNSTYVLLFDCCRPRFDKSLQ